MATKKQAAKNPETKTSILDTKDKLIKRLQNTITKLENTINKVGIRTNETITSAQQLKTVLRPHSMWYFFNLLRNGKSVRKFILSIGDDTKPGI